MWVLFTLFWGTSQVVGVLECHPHQVGSHRFEASRSRFREELLLAGRGSVTANSEITVSRGSMQSLLGTTP